MSQSGGWKVRAFIILIVFTFYNIVWGNPGFYTGIASFSAFILGFMLWAERRDRNRQRWN